MSCTFQAADVLLCAAVRTVLLNSSTIEVAVGLHEDARFEFPCSAQSDDSTPVSVRWYRIDEDNEEVVVRDVPDRLALTKNGSLIIQLAKNVTDTDSWTEFLGEYRCRVSNSYSQAERVVLIRDKNYIAPGQYHVSVSRWRSG